jgi:adenylate cyclase
VKIFEELKIFNEFLKQKGFEVAIRTRIGLSTGEAVVGNMGSKARFDFTAIGDTINLASRLENLNKQYGTRVMMSEICAQGVLALDGLDARIRELDFVVVKGKTKAVRVYELLVDETLLGNSAKAMKYVDALNLYRKRDFAGAVEVLKQMGIGSESSNFDLPAARLYGLCEALLKNPPSESWQPVNFMGEFKI